MGRKFAMGWSLTPHHVGLVLLLLLQSLTLCTSHRWAKFTVYHGVDEGDLPTDQWKLGNGRHMSHTQGRAALPADDSVEAEAMDGYLPEWWEAKTDSQGGTY